jgi:hypothetical protein
VTVASPDEGSELEPAGPDDVELLEVVDLDQPQELDGGITVDARVATPRPRKRRNSEIPPPRRWPRVGHRELRTCPICHLVTADMQEAFWHMQASHGGDTPDDVDAEEWIDDAQAELEELRGYIRSGKVRRWRSAEPDPGLSGSHMAAALIGVMVFMVLVFIVYVIVNH